MFHTISFSPTGHAPHSNEPKDKTCKLFLYQGQRHALGAYFRPVQLPFPSVRDIYDLGDGSAVVVGETGMLVLRGKVTAHPLVAARTRHQRFEVCPTFSSRGLVPEGRVAVLWEFKGAWGGAGGGYLRVGKGSSARAYHYDYLLFPAKKWSFLWTHSAFWWCPVLGVTLLWSCGPKHNGQRPRQKKQAGGGTVISASLNLCADFVAHWLCLPSAVVADPPRLVLVCLPWVPLGGSSIDLEPGFGLSRVEGAHSRDVLEGGGGIRLFKSWTLVRLRGSGG